MSKTALGATKRWDANIYDGGLQPADPSSLTLTVFSPLDSVVDGFPVNYPPIIRDAQGLYHYDWPIPFDAPLGTYHGEWTGILNGGPITGFEDIEVVPVGSIEAPLVEESPAVYMTPGRFKAGGYGVSLVNLNDFGLGTQLEDASAIVNSYCNMPLLPMPGSFLGGRAVDEEHRWRFARTFHDTGTRRVYPKHWPIVNVEKLELVVGHNAGALIPADTLVINNAERWIEVTALTISTSGGLFGTTGWVVPIGGLMQPKAQITYTWGWSLPVGNEKLRLVPGTGFIYQARHGFWTSTPPGVSVDGVLADPGDYTVDTDEGWIIFTADPGGVVRASYEHRLPWEIARATALVAVELVSEGNLQRKGLTSGLSSVRVNEIELRRQIPRGAVTASELPAISPQAALLLEGFRYWAAA